VHDPLVRSTSKILEETRAEIQVLGATAHTPVDDLGIGRFPVDGDSNTLETVRAPSPRWSVQRDNKVTGSILFAASTHPNSEVCELPRGSLLEGLECFVARGPPGKQVWGHGSRGEPDCTSGEN